MLPTAHTAAAQRDWLTLLSVSSTSWKSTMFGCEQVRSAFSSFSICASWCDWYALGERDDAPPLVELAPLLLVLAPDPPVPPLPALRAMMLALSKILMATVWRNSSLPNFTCAKMPDLKETTDSSRDDEQADERQKSQSHPAISLQRCQRAFSVRNGQRAAVACCGCRVPDDSSD